MLFYSLFKILSEILWAEHSNHEQKRLFQVLTIWVVLGVGAIIMFARNLFFAATESCFICDIALIATISLGIVCAINGKMNCTINSVFTIPVFIYAYFLSDIGLQISLAESVYSSVSILFFGLIFLLFYSREVSRVKFYFLTGIAFLAFHMYQADLIIKSFTSVSELAKNPLVIFSLIFLATFLLRRKYMMISRRLRDDLKSYEQSINKVVQDTGSPIVSIKAVRDEAGNIEELTIQKVNNAFESKFNINSYEVHNQDANYIFDLIFKQQFDINEIIHFKRKRTKEFYYKSLDLWFKVNLLIPEYNKFYLIFEDITKIKKQIEELKENKRRYQVLLEAIPDIFFVIDKDGTYEDFVVKESDLFKIEDTNIIGSSIYDVGFPQNMANKIYSCIRSSIKNNSIESIEYSLNTPNGTFLYEMRLAKLSPNSVISIARDITKRKTAEFNLEKALVKAEESDRLKSAFLANLSHEIRTPMNVITNFSRILAETELDYEDKLEITDGIIQNGKQLLNMIDNTIHLSKIETEAIEVNFKFCQINELLRDVYNRFFPHIPDSKDIELNLQLNVLHKEFGFVTDQKLLSDAIVILVDNALKYTLNGQINIGYEMIRNELVKFTISDTGIGIPQNESENIFSRFYRLNNSINESTSGSGLGLSIAQHYISMIGGKLEFESEQNVGSKFYFTLPFKEGKGFMTLVS